MPSCLTARSPHFTNSPKYDTRWDKAQVRSHQVTRFSTSLFLIKYCQNFLQIRKRSATQNAERSTLKGYPSIFWMPQIFWSIFLLNVTTSRAIRSIDEEIEYNLALQYLTVISFLIYHILNRLTSNPIVLYPEYNWSRILYHSTSDRLLLDIIRDQGQNMHSNSFK